VKLAFLIYHYFPYGGQQRDFLRIVQECQRRGNTIDVYTLRWQGDIPAGIQVHFAPVRSLSRLGLYRRFTRWAQQQLQRTPSDCIVGFNAMPGLDVYFAADACFEEKARHQRPFYYRYSSRYQHFSRYEAAVFGSASQTRVMVLSPLQQQAFEKHYPHSRERMTLVPSGIDPDRMLTADADSVRSRLREEIGLKHDELLVLQVGSGFRIKGVDRSLLAIAALPAPLLQRVRYLLIGQDKPGRYLRLARRLGISQRLQILPGRDDIPRFLLGADLLLHPAYSESAGYVLLEATMAGLPVLTTASCGYAYHVLQAGSGQVCSEPFQQQELNRRLEDMLTSSERDCWSANGRQYGRQTELYALPREAANLIERVGQSRIARLAGSVSGTVTGRGA
jgi:UDP-glucose:(heptosyl)LPS alpha-1,3-glucosyltransferase